MLAGHFATALIAGQRTSGRRSPGALLGWYLFVSQLPDLLWFAFHFLGLEPTEPRDLFDTTLQTMSAELLFSHHLLPVLGWTVGLGVLGGSLFRSRGVGLATAALVGIHALMDYLSGHPHHVFGPETAEVGFGLYAYAPYVAIAIEAVVTAVLLEWFFREERRRGVERSVGNHGALIGLFVFGIVFMLSTATVSMREMLGLPDFDLPFGTMIPTLVVVYVGMGAFLWTVARRTEATDPLERQSRRDRG